MINELKSSVARCECDDPECPVGRALADLESASRADLLKLVEALDLQLLRTENAYFLLQGMMAELETDQAGIRN